MAKSEVDGIMQRADRMRSQGAISDVQHAKLKKKAMSLKPPMAPGSSTAGPLKGAGLDALSAAGGDKTAAVKGPPGPPLTSKVRPASQAPVDTVAEAGSPSWGNESAPAGGRRKVMTGA